VPLSMDINALLSFRKVIDGGFAYRLSESVAFLLRLQLTHQLQLGYSYDYPLSYASRLSNSSHEFLIQYQFKKIVKHVTSPR
jgi:hypothetical protein